MCTIDRPTTGATSLHSLRHAAMLCIAVFVLCWPSVRATATGEATYQPASDDPASAWIASLLLHDDPASLTLELTTEGLAYAGTCDGAAALAEYVVIIHDRMPAASDSIGWARERMTREIYGHGRAAAGDLPFPEAVERANPIAIVFTDYTDPLLAFTDTEAWTFQRGYATLYRLECGT